MRDDAVVVDSSDPGSRDIEHIGSADDGVELELLKAGAPQRSAAGQSVLEFGLDTAVGGPLPITSSRMGGPFDTLARANRLRVFEDATGADEAFALLVLTRIVESGGKLDSLRVLENGGLAPASHATLKAPPSRLRSASVARVNFRRLDAPTRGASPATTQRSFLAEFANAAVRLAGQRTLFRLRRARLRRMPPSRPCGNGRALYL